VALTNFKLLLCVLTLSESTLAQAECLKTVSDVRANGVKARWQETTQNDGKPLTISIAKRSQRSCLLRQQGRFALAGRERIRLSFRRRYRDYFEKHQSYEQCPDACKASLTFHAVSPNC
jgi:hypothetical protein